MKLCECGCGKPVIKSSNRFILVHHLKIRKGKTWEEIWGKEQAEERRKRMSERMKKQTSSKETNKKRANSVNKYYNEHPEENKIRNDRTKNLMSHPIIKQKAINNMKETFHRNPEKYANIIMKNRIKKTGWMSKLEKRLSSYLIENIVQGTNYQIKVNDINGKTGHLDFIGEKIFQGKPIEFHPYNPKDEIDLSKDEKESKRYWYERSRYRIVNPLIKEYHNKALEEIGLIVIVKVLFRRNNIRLIWYEKENNEIVKKEGEFLI